MEFFLHHLLIIGLCLLLMIWNYIVNYVNPFINAAENKPVENHENGIDSVKSVLSIQDLPKVSSHVRYIDPVTGQSGSSLCNENGLFLGHEDSFADCNNICRTSGFTYRYFQKMSYLTKHLMIAKPGAYCVPQKIVKCNPYTTTIVRGVFDWQCNLKWPGIFGGENGTEIKICGGKLRDMLTGTDYENFIPTNLEVGPENEQVSIDAQKVSHVPRNLYFQMKNAKGKLTNATTPRFVCWADLVTVANGSPVTSTPRDEMGNAYVYAQDVSHFTRVGNECAKFIRGAHESVRPDFLNGQCECIKGLHTVLPPFKDDEKNYFYHQNDYDDTNSTFDYFKIFETGRYGYKDDGHGNESIATYQQPSVCSPCPYGFVKLNEGGSIVKPLTNTIFERDNDRNLISIPLVCIHPNDTIHQNHGIKTFMDASRLCSGMSSAQDSGIQCVSALVDISTGLSQYAKKLLATK